MISSRCPPTRIPRSPFSHPGFDSSFPSWKMNGFLPFSQLLSKGRPVTNLATNLVTSTSPGSAFIPMPFFRSLTTRFFGGFSFGTTIFGALSAPTTRVVRLDSPPSLPLSSADELPQPATRRPRQSNAASALSGRMGILPTEELRRWNPDHLSCEPLPGPVDDPGGIDFSDLEVEAELVFVRREVFEVGKAGVVAPGQQLFDDYRLRLHVDNLLPIAAVDVAGGGGDQP